MPQCNQCNNDFPATKVIDGKVRNFSQRVSCLDCKPYVAQPRAINMVIVNCKSCGIQFEKAPCELQKSGNNYCSRRCFGKSKVAAPIRTCKKCGEQFKQTRKYRGKVICINCDAGYETKTDYFKSLTIGEYHELPSVKNKHPSWKNAHVRSFNRSWNKDLLNHGCVICGYIKHIELAHIKAVSSFSPTSTLGEINSPHNNLPLCRNHHWELDNDQLEDKSKHKINIWRGKLKPDKYHTTDVSIDSTHKPNAWSEKPKKHCIECGIMISKTNTGGYCRQHTAYASPSKITWPSIEELLQRLEQSSYCKLGRELGVSDNAIRKHIQRHQ